MTRPILILLCGIPGSGKTTYAEKMKNSYTYHLSSDAIRKELYGDENIQGNSSDVFALMQDRAIVLLNNGFDVIYDATNITRKDRASIITKCPKVAQVECHIIWAPIETCIERDAARKRTVGKEVINRMLKRFQAPYYDEGIDEIKIVLPDDFDCMNYRLNIANAMKMPHDNPHHTLDIQNHCYEAAKYAHEHFDEEDLVSAAMWHDVGKSYVKSFTDANGHPSEYAHFYQHQCCSAWMVYGVEYNFAPRVAWLISTHMDPFLNTKYYNRLPAYLKKQVDLLHEADIAAH